MDTPCNLGEPLLLEYILGAAAPEVRAAIERSPACLTAVERLTRDLLPFMHILYRVSCPDPDTLVAYQERRVSDGALQLALRRHLADCPLCQEEYALLVEIDAVPLTPPSPVRSVIEALFQPPLALPQAVRGQALHYRTPHYDIHLRVRPGLERPREWALRGQVYTSDGLPALDRVQAVHMRAEGQKSGAVIEGGVDARALFRVDRLLAGMYALHILTADEEIVIRSLRIGDER